MMALSKLQDPTEVATGGNERCQHAGCPCCRLNSAKNCNTVNFRERHLARTAGTAAGESPRRKSMAAGFGLAAVRGMRSRSDLECRAKVRANICEACAWRNVAVQ